MNCQQSRGLMMDALYGEDLAIQESFEFFKHQDACRECRLEYLELLQTREVLSRWELPLDAEADAGEAVPAPTRWRQTVKSGISWWGFLQRAAAGVLILLGAAAAVQGIGVWKTDKVTVSQQELMEMVNDMIVTRQAEERRVIGHALVNFADDVSQQHRQYQSDVSDKLYLMQQQFLDLQEENNHYLKTLLSR